MSGDFADLPGVALVAGGSGGIGAAVCRLLAARGSTVALLYRRHEAAADAVVRSVTDAGGRAAAHRVDLGDAAATAATVRTVAAAGLHTVVYAAGPHVPQRHLSRVDAAELAAQLDADALGCFHLVAPALPYLRAARGSVVAVTTAATARHPVRDGLSAVPKAAVEALVRGLAVEEGRFGVRANCVAPGMLADGMSARLQATGDLDARALDAARAAIPLRRFGAAADVAEAVCFLASARAGFVSGQTLRVDGGYAT